MVCVRAFVCCLLVLLAVATVNDRELYVQSLLLSYSQLFHVQSLDAWGGLVLLWLSEFSRVQLAQPKQNMASPMNREQPVQHG